MGKEATINMILNILLKSVSRISINLAKNAVIVFFAFCGKLYHAFYMISITHRNSFYPHNVLGILLKHHFLFLLLFSFYRGVFISGVGGVNTITLFLTLFILFDFWGLDKKGGTFDCFSLFFPKNEILISLLHVHYLVEHLVKEMDGLNNACVLDIVYFVEGNCSFLTNLFAVSYRSKPTTICVILMKKMR